MKFKLEPYIKEEVYQLRNIDKKNKYTFGNIYLVINLRLNTIKENYSKGFFNQQQIKEILKLVELLADNKYITEIELELNREGE
jgi:hypothetical protein